MGIIKSEWKEKVLYGSARIDVTKDNITDYDFWSILTFQKGVVILYIKSRVNNRRSTQNTKVKPLYNCKNRQVTVNY